MNERKRVFFLILIMATSSLIVAGATIFMLYRAALEEEGSRLVETAQSQARLIEAVARFDAIHSLDYAGGSLAATLSQIIDAHKHYKGFGDTGEFTLAKREGHEIVFLLSHRHYDLRNLRPVPFDSDLAEPMRRALSGLSGTLVGLDYRGELVLAAHEPVAEVNLGIVAKIDLAEIRAPFVRSGAIAVGFAVLVVLAGAALFLRISNPMIKRLENHSAELSKSNEELMREIDERKRAEEALKQAHNGLERKVDERTAELSMSNTFLRQEIEERKKAEEALKRSEVELRHLSSRLLEAHEEESKRIGQDLHDGLAQSLSAVKVWGEAAFLYLNKEDIDNLTESLGRIVALAQGCVEEVRRIILNLRPSILDDLGILATISWLCQNFQAMYSGVRIEKEIEIQESDVPDSLKVVIFRVIQEALNNITKHSKADLVSLYLKGTDNKIELTIADNGVGFEAKQRPFGDKLTRGLGLSSMKERVGLSGGTFEIESGEGAGTTIRALWEVCDNVITSLQS